jgi:RNA polymerase sigma factor (sigma-70 family)
MKPVSAAAALQRASRQRGGEAAWNERAGRLFEELERPARTMVRRAFRGAFSADELDDIYASAWAGTLRALGGRSAELSDDEIRSYLLTAVANQAGKELRRRRRKPTAPLELVRSVPDEADTPDEAATSAEQSRVTRDLLASLPPRRRAVMLLRYGWGLDPSQVCALVKGLSPRAYRKEITRGVEELSAKMRALERGEWCADREPVLRAYAAGLADADQRRQARAHLAHCRECTGFVARLSGHLHDLGSAGALTTAIDGVDGRLSLADRVADLGERARDAASGLFARGGSSGAEEAASHVAAAGGIRGAGAAGAGVVAKLAGLSAAGKVAVACVGAAAVVPCVSVLSGDREQEPKRVRSAPAPERAQAERPPARTPEVEVLPTQVGNEAPPSPPPDFSPAPEPRAPQQSEPVEPVEPVAPSEPVPVEEAPASDFSFGAESASAAPAPAPAPSSPPATPTPSGGSDSGGGGAPQGGDFAFGQ